jgi:predicted ATPase with chaperone activity
MNLQDEPDLSGTAIPMVDLGDLRAPAAPKSLEDMDLESQVLSNLVLKLAYTTSTLTTEWAAEQLALPLGIAAELLEGLRADLLVEVLGRSGPLGYRFAISKLGRERASRLMEISGYVGPAPVSLDRYTQFLNWQFEHLPVVRPERVAEVLSQFVLPRETVEVVGLAALSRRSLFLHGPAGNGKTSIGHLIHEAVEGDLWIPWCIGVDENIIRVFDPQTHELSADPATATQPSAIAYDRRWLRIRRPFIVVGGELTIDALDLIYVPAVGYYEAPMHFKANGGTFLLDDFGCQRVEPVQLLNRWVVPLEKQVDYLTLRTGQQIQVPFRQMLVVSTNLDPDRVMTPAFLRRIGYRIHVKDPTPDDYAEIFRRFAQRDHLAVSPDVIEHLQWRYEQEGRSMRGCEPRDLILRAKDICRYHRKPAELTKEILDLAWRGYFGNVQR